MRRTLSKDKLGVKNYIGHKSCDDKNKAWKTMKKNMKLLKNFLNQIFLDIKQALDS